MYSGGRLKSFINFANVEVSLKYFNLLENVITYKNKILNNDPSK